MQSLTTLKLWLLMVKATAGPMPIRTAWRRMADPEKASQKCWKMHLYFQSSLDTGKVTCSPISITLFLVIAHFCATMGNATFYCGVHLS